MSESGPVSIDELMVRRLAARIAELEMQNAVLAATLEMVGLQMQAPVAQESAVECTCTERDTLSNFHAPDCPAALDADEPIAG